MRIAQLALPFESVPPARYGGTERVVSTLTEELVRRGHQVTLFAPGDSRTAARLEPTVPEALWHCDPPLQAVLTTLHGRLDLPELQPLYRRFCDVPLVSISDAQRRPVAWANFVATIQHGIELDEFTFNGQPGHYLAFLGRIASEKGLDTAIRVAQRAGLPLEIAARKPLLQTTDPNIRRDWKHYHDEIKPLLERNGARLIGEVDGPRRDTFLGNAAALLFPIRWPEPFGLVMVEALACGTPVIALNDGSVPEVLEDGVTGFICSTEDEMVDAVRRIGEIDRARCRAVAERRFSPTGMAEQYEQVYARLCKPASVAA